jgi:hypothetical protein
MKHIHFFALREDLLSMLNAAEQEGPLIYTRAYDYAGDENLEVLNSGVEIPKLGRATHHNAIGSETFLVSFPELSIRPRPIAATGRIAIDQLWNPDTVTFTPGGLWNEDVVLYGRVATVSDSRQAQELMKRFHSAIRKHFTKIGGYYVGPQALELLKLGKRLTIGAYSPSDYDLRIESKSV